MGIEGRLNELKRKHRDLKARITEELKRPARDDLRIAELKREKLKIKDELSGLGAA